MKWFYIETPALDQILKAHMVEGENKGPRNHCTNITMVFFSLQVSLILPMYMMKISSNLLLD